MLTEYLKRKLHQRLEGITGGRLILKDGPVLRTFGTSGAGELSTAMIVVEDQRFYRMVALGGSIGAGEAFMRGYWTASDLTACLRIMARNRPVHTGLDRRGSRIARVFRSLRHRFRRNSRRGSKRNIADHYDLGNGFYRLMLDETMTYSSGIFEHPHAGLREAQIAKLDRICRKLDLSPGDRVLEIGTGWGSFAIHAARHYGVHVTTTTISKEQHDLAAERVAAAGLGDRVELLLNDYRDLTGRFDKVVSIEMIEAVGCEYLDTYFGKISDLLEDNGAALLQAITMPDQDLEDYRHSVDFIQRYIFPGGFLPSIGSMVSAMTRATDLRMVHLEDLTPHYETTLNRWRKRFLRNRQAVKDLGYPERFRRMWEFYLCYCEAGFAERVIGEAQVVFAKPRFTGAPILGAIDGQRFDARVVMS
jgi:cyclopropane-fatty-acyl-phospholipid synthase